MPRSGARRQTLVILAACGGAAVVFIGGALFYIQSHNTKMQNNRDMTAAAPKTLQQGAESNIFTASDSNTAGDDITGYHPAYLLGAISEIFNGSPDCDSTRLIFDSFTARCNWQGGYLIVDSNTMPESPLHKKSPNVFNESGLPVDANGALLLTSSAATHVYNRTSIRIDGLGPKFKGVGNRIVSVLTGHTLADVERNGSWFTADGRLGYQACNFYVTSNSLDAYCFQKA